MAVTTCWGHSALARMFREREDIYLMFINTGTWTENPPKPSIDTNVKFQQIRMVVKPEQRFLVEPTEGGSLKYNDSYWGIADPTDWCEVGDANHTQHPTNARFVLLRATFTVTKEVSFNQIAVYSHVSLREKANPNQYVFERGSIDIDHNGLGLINLIENRPISKLMPGMNHEITIVLEF